MSKKLLPTILLAFSLPIVKAEMTLNKEGLPTPWPVAMIGGFITLGLAMSLIKKDNEETGNQGGLSKITRLFKKPLVVKSLAVYSVLNVLISLIGSWNSLRVHGLSGLQYPELAFLASIPIFPMWWSDSDLEGGNKLSGGTLVITAMLTFVISGIWSGFTLGFSFGLKNFSTNAQFITNCTAVPQTSWQTIAKCTSLVDGSYSCYLGSKNTGIIGLFVRALIILLWALLTFVGEKMLNRIGNVREGERKMKFGVKFSIGLITTLYVVSTAVIQAKGLDIAGLESCDLNSTLLNSKTGYFLEGYQQEGVALKQIALI